MEPDRAADSADHWDANPGITTGEPRVDAALRTLSGLGELPVSEHPAVFERVHSQLVEVLGELRTEHHTEHHTGGPQQ